MIRRLATIACVAACLVAATPAGVPKQADAAAQLEHAAHCRSLLRGKRGEEREAFRERAVEAYRAVHVHFPRALAQRAEASFREGELRRAGGDADEARAAFEAAAQHGAGTEFRARAWIEVGHLYRRSKRYVDALASYERVLLDEESAPTHRDRALLWRARLQARLGRGKEARASWERVARDGFDPFDRLEAFDAWALNLIAVDDLEGAAGVLGLCSELLAERLAEETRTGERLRRAHARMPSIARLEAAVEARRKLREREREQGGSAIRVPDRGPDRGGASLSLRWSPTSRAAASALPLSRPAPSPPLAGARAAPCAPPRTVASRARQLPMLR